MQHEHETDVHWQAFRYVAGEMTEGESDRFEEQLALDQAAREAVSEVAQLAQTVALSESQPPVTLHSEVADGSRRRLLRAGSWMGLGAAVCLAIVLSAGWLDFSTDAPVVEADGTHQQAIADEAATRLAMSWIETKDELAEQAFDAQDSLIDLLDAAEDEIFAWEIVGEASGADDIDGETPSWLLLAVLEEQGELAPEEN